MFNFLRRRAPQSADLQKHPGAMALLEHCLERAAKDPTEIVVVLPKLVPTYLETADTSERGKLFKALVKNLRHGEDVEQFVRALFKGVSTDRAVRYASIGHRTERLPGTDVDLAIRSAAEARRARMDPPLAPGVMAWLRALDSDAVLYDIGAGVGVVSLLAVQGGSGRRVVAFEPAFFNFSALCENVSLNKLGHQITPLHAAVTDRTGLGPFFSRVVERGTGEHSFGRPVNRGGNPFEPEEVTQVPGLRLDDAVSMLGLPAPTHLLVDVDGAEAAVLRGAESLLRGGSIRGMMVALPAEPERASEIEGIVQQFGWTAVETDQAADGVREFRPAGTPAAAAREAATR